MFWNKKEEKSLPELPPMRPSFGTFKEEEESETVERSSLPSFPETKREEAEMPPRFKAPKAREVEEMPPKRMTSEIKFPAKTEDVYVKIDRFHTARKSLNGARDKLAVIEELMRKIRETRMREEQELASWEKDIDSVKTKVEDVTKNIFEKVE
jgi:uncharacterized protein YlxW (UPF0749 family)